MIAPVLLMAAQVGMASTVNPYSLATNSHSDGWSPYGSQWAREDHLRLSLEGDAASEPAGVAVDTRDWRGLRMDAYYFLVYQFGVIGILYVMPEDLSGWSEENKTQGLRFNKYKDNIRHLVWDTDKWYINYILHPYWGGTYYVRARERGFGPQEGFWFAALLSTFYEYGAEAMFEKPSMQDMIFTPVGGAFFGEYMWEVRQRVRQRNEGVVKMNFPDRFLMLATDPLGALNRSVGRWIGHDAYLDVQPYLLRGGQAVAQEGGRQRLMPSDTVIGLNMRMEW
ncbi:MAG: hypothetical protein A2V90_05925 [Gammaproteobacteria bacterium RBG_16_57_12]|nr:MAG: hypothetical protein A2V90_05925 [Gammaproteobacteria bacterium RBG_16_57_12]